MRLTAGIADAARSHLTMRQRGRLAERRVWYRKPLARYRALPDFLILGAQRCGTSSLYRYLGAHPDLIPGIRKEIRYFSTRFSEGERWYRAHFPLRHRVAVQGLLRGHRPLSFEATPDYLFHPFAPQRASRVLENAKFIILLRDPVERAFSHYKHMRRLRFEELSFEEAVEREEERIRPEFQQLYMDPSRELRTALRFSYVARGQYAQQLERWFEVFSRDHFLILESDSLFNQQASTLRRICSFLEIRTWTPNDFKNYSRKPSSEYEKVERQIFFPSDLERTLRVLFDSQNRELERLTETTFPWS